MRIMIVLLAFLPALVLSAESAIDWSKCGKENICYCAPPGTTVLDTQEDADAAVFDANCKDVGMQNRFFTEDVALFQLQVTGDAVIDPTILTLYQESASGNDKRLMFGCKFENGEPSLVENMSEDKKINYTKEYKMSLFEDRSRFEKGHVLCAVKVERAARLEKSLKRNDYTVLHVQTSQPTQYKARKPERKFFESTDIMKCDPYSFKNKLSASLDYQVLQVINRDKDLMGCVNDSYTIRYEHSGSERGELEKLECKEDPNIANKFGLSILKKGESDPIDVTAPEAYTIYCGAKFEEVCRDPNDCEPGPLCPVYKAGKIDEPAKLTCTGNKWMIDNEYVELTEDPVCKKDSNLNRAAFHFKLPSGWHKRMGVRCFTEYDCKKNSKLIYSCLDEATCAMVDDSNGKLKCKDETKTLTIFNKNATQNESSSYECNTATGLYTNGTAIVKRRSRVSCIGTTAPRVKVAEAEISDIVIYGSIGGITLAIVVIFVAILLCVKFWNKIKARFTMKGKAAWKRLKNRKKRIAYCKKAFSEIVNSTTENSENIIAGLNLIDAMLDAGTNDPECWEEASSFLRRLQGTVQKVDYPISHMLSRYMFLQAWKIIEQHGWISDKPIRNNARKGLIRSVAIQLLAFAINDRENTEAEDLVQSGFIKLGLNAVEQYPHCGLMWSLIMHTQPLAKKAKTGPTIAKFDAFALKQNLRDIIQQAPFEIPKEETIPGFGSVSQQAAYALGAAPELRFFESKGRTIFYQADRNEDGEVQRAFFRGLSETASRVPGQSILFSTGMWPKVNDKFMGKVTALAPPESDWIKRVQHAMNICCYYGRFLDAKRLLNRFMPDQKDTDAVLSKLSQQQQDFEDAVEKVKEDIRAWLAKRTDKDELKQKPVIVANPKIQLDNRITGDTITVVDGSARTTKSCSRADKKVLSPSDSDVPPAAAAAAAAATTPSAAPSSQSPSKPRKDASQPAAAATAAAAATSPAAALSPAAPIAKP